MNHLPRRNKHVFGFVGLGSVWWTYVLLTQLLLLLLSLCSALVVCLVPSYDDFHLLFDDFIFLYWTIFSKQHPQTKRSNPQQSKTKEIMPADLLHPSPEHELRTHKLKRLVQSPNSFFMDIKCPGCFQITTVFSHAQTVVLCANCNIILCQPTGGRARLTEGCSYRKKVD